MTNALHLAYNAINVTICWLFRMQLASFILSNAEKWNCAVRYLNVKFVSYKVLWPDVMEAATSKTVMQIVCYQTLVTAAGLV